MKKILLNILVMMFALISHAQEDGRLDDKIDEITYQWDLQADKLSTYQGLIQLCGDEEYRKEVFGLLDEIHHYDSVLYDVLLKLEHTSSDKEIKKTLKEIKKFEEEYSTKGFTQFMSEECKEARYISKNEDKLKNDVGANSYSGRIYMLELDLLKYVNHITSRVDNIRKHVHHLSDHYEN